MKNKAKQVIIAESGKLLITEADMQSSFKGALLLEADSCLLDVPVVVASGATTGKNNQNAKIHCANVSRVKETNSSISQILLGSTVASGVTNCTGSYRIATDKIVDLEGKISSDEACFIGLGARYLQIIRRANIGLGHKVLVVGQGLAGQIANQVLLHCSADVLATDADDFRLGITGKRCVKNVNLLKPDTFRRTYQEWSEFGADFILVTGIVIEEEILETILRLIRLGGTVIFAYPQAVRMDSSILSEKNLTILNQASLKTWSDHFSQNEVIAPKSYLRWDAASNLQEAKNMLLAGSICVQDLITHRFQIRRTHAETEMPLELSANHMGILLNFA